MSATVAASAHEGIARAALDEFARPGEVGDLIDEVDEGDGAWTLHFAATMLGYPGWRWTVSIAQLPDEEPTVLEAELLPGDGALLAPDWVPWSQRLEEWRAQQAAEGGAGDAGEAPDADGSSDDEDDDDLEDEDLDDDEDELEDVLDEDDDLGDDVYDGLDPEAAMADDDEED